MNITDPAPIARHLRSMYGSRLLIAAVSHLKVFEQFSTGPIAHDALAERLGLKPRPAMVLFPALCAMGFLRRDAAGNLSLTEAGNLLRTSSEPCLTGYVGLEAEDAGALALVEHLRNDGPRDASEGMAYIKDDDAPSPMDDPALARYLTLALAGRAQAIAPVVAEAVTKSSGHLLDVAGGSGFYTFEWLRLNPRATATLLDRSNVLAVAREKLDAFCAHGDAAARSVKDRVTFAPGDMLKDPLPRADLLFAFSLFHDWPEDVCENLAARFSAALNPRGELWVHDVFLDDTLDGPLHASDYSAALFSITKGRIYSRSEHRAWLARAGLVALPQQIATRMDYGLIAFRKP